MLSELIEERIKQSLSRSSAKVLIGFSLATIESDATKEQVKAQEIIIATRDHKNIEMNFDHFSGPEMLLPFPVTVNNSHENGDFVALANLK